MFTFLGILFTVALLVLIVMLLVNLGHSKLSDSIIENASTCLLFKVVTGLLLIGIAVCWFKSCS